MNNFLTKSIRRQNHEHQKRYFFANIDGELLLLRLNDFPDEPLFTLIRGLEIVDIEEAPKDWYIPYR